MRSASLVRQAAVLAAAALGAISVSLPAASSAAVSHAALSLPAPASSRAPGMLSAMRRATLPSSQRYACPAPTKPGQMVCQSIVRAIAGNVPAATAASVAGYSPASLRSAYKIVAAAARNGRGRTVAIVDAYNDPRAARDLATYRAHFHLGACTTASKCLRIVNQHGKTRPLPKANGGWAGEESLDLDMVSAICPKCRILLVEASSNSAADLGIAESRAVAMGAKYVSNSWSGGEFIGQDAYDHYFNHPGVAIAFASGDFGYGAAYPVDLQFVTAVGGTSLHRSHNRRGWSEQAWGNTYGGTGSGCSTLEAKPSWQRADANAVAGCLNRTENDVAAVANPATGVAVYDTYSAPGTRKGWNEFGGTSVATPIITAVYALAGTPTTATYPAEYPYLHYKHEYDITSGSNGTCDANRRYLCHGVRGYDGPTGLGTPSGTAAFTDSGAHRVTLVDPGTQDRPAGGAFSLRIKGLDTRGGSISLSYSAAGLPSGLTIKAVPHSNDGRITGTLPGTPGTFHVTVRAKDGKVTGTTYLMIVTVPSLTAASPVPGPVTIASGTLCLDDGTGAAGQRVRVQACTTPASQDWAYQATAGPTGSGALTIGGQCLGLSGNGGVLASCNGSASQRWQYLGFGQLASAVTGRCLIAPSLVAGTAVTVKACNGSKFQRWTLPPGPVVSGAGATCLNGSGSPGAQVTVESCAAASSQQQWTARGDGTIRLAAGGLCLDSNLSTTDGTFVTATTCASSSAPQDMQSQLWVAGPGGQLINAWSGRCLADQNNGGPGTGLVQEDCYGLAGEIWGIN